MICTKRILLLITLLLMPVFLNAEGVTDGEQRWTFSQRFQGSSNSAGVVLKTDSTALYTFNNHIKGYGGFPIYFAQQKSSSGAHQFMSGVGNVYGGFLVTAENSALRYSSDLVATAPTGDRSRGFSTGHPTVDWTNTFSHASTFVTPYASIGAANTISDTAFFVRPFSSHGFVAHFEAGALFDAARHVRLGASAYGVRAKGEQEIISKVVETPGGPDPLMLNSPLPGASQSGVLLNVTKNAGLGNTGLGNIVANTAKDRVPPVFETKQETLAPAEVANDHGFSTWLTLRPASSTDLQIGYSRSVAYQFNSVFFGIGFHFSH